MANLNKKTKHIVDVYVKYFGRVATEDEIRSFDDVKTLSKITAEVRVNAANESGLKGSDYLNSIIQNLFGRSEANAFESKYAKKLNDNVYYNLPIATIIKKGSKDDKGVYNAKKLVAEMVATKGGSYELDNITQENYKSIYNVKTGLTVKTIAELEAKISNVPDIINGKTIILTESVDAGKDFTGTTKNDLFIAENTTGPGAKTTATAADILDGGKGTDTFKLYDKAAADAATLPTLKNIENVALYNLTNGDFDAKKWDTVETLYVVSAGAATGNGLELGEKVTTVNFEDIDAGDDQELTFDDAVTAATLGVNKVGAVANPVTVTVDGDALKTLTINAYGKASEVELAQTAATIETLNINGKADLTLDFDATVPASKLVTIDGSKAQGKLVLDLTNTNTIAGTLKTVKTGTGDDKLTLNIAVDSGTTIDLGAGNDKLVKGTAVGAKVNDSTTTVIDGGAGIDTLDASLVTVGNAGVFANFEILSLTSTTVDATATPPTTALDLNLLTKSTFTEIALDTGASVNTLLNVKKSQSLTVNAAATTTTLTFKASEVAGTADAYTINFSKDTAAAGVNAGTVSVEGIETVTVNSVGKTGATNTIALKDADAKSLVITGDKALTVTFATQFGATTPTAENGLGVSTIDASASTAGITLASLVTNLKIADAGLTIKGGAGADSITTGATAKALTIETGAGKDTINLSDATTATEKIIVNAGAGDDTITLGATGGTFTLGTGADTIIVKNAIVGVDSASAVNTVATGAIKTTITDIEKGDKITFTAGGTLTKADISLATDLDSALKAAATDANGNKTWFQYDGNTYIFDDNNAGTKQSIDSLDVVVKLNGLVDLSNSSLNGGLDLTIA